MIESTPGLVQTNTVKSNTNRQKVDADKKAPNDTAIGLHADQLAINPAKVERHTNRPIQNAIEDESEAESLAGELSSQLLQFSSLAESAQANLNPDKVLELIA